MSGTRSHLTEAERGELARIMAERPGATNAQVARIFEARTGRKINRGSVGARRRRGPREDRPGFHLTEAERATLDLLIAESDADAGYREIAQQFEAMTGRPITFQRVWQVATTAHGRPKVGQGRRPKQATPALARRIDDASGKKLARAGVDRTPRVGRQGRVCPGGGSPC